MPPAPIRAEIRREAKKVTLEEIERTGLAGWYAPFFIAQERVAARSQMAKSLEAQRIDQLERRIRQLEATRARDARNANGNFSDIGKQFGDLINQMSVITNAVEGISERQLKFKGIYEVGRTYSRGSMVVRNGGLWHCNNETSEQPGKSDHWQLCVKSGEARGPTLA
jgi:hypothetical protein